MKAVLVCGSPREGAVSVLPGALKRLPTPLAISVDRLSDFGGPTLPTRSTELAIRLGWCITDCVLPRKGCPLLLEPGAVFGLEPDAALRGDLLGELLCGTLLDGFERDTAILGDFIEALQLPGVCFGDQDLVIVRRAVAGLEQGLRVDAGDLAVEKRLDFLEVALRLLHVFVRERLVEFLVHLEVDVHRDVDRLDFAFGLHGEAASGGEKRCGDKEGGTDVHFCFPFSRFE